MKDFVCLYSIEALGLDNKEKTYQGFLFADTFTDAVEQLEKKLYGDNLIKINSIELYDTIPEFSREIYLALQKEFSK